MKNKYFLVSTIIGAVLILDQITKYLIETHVRLFEVIRIVPGFFNIMHVRNKGSAFSVCSGSPEVFRSMFFITITIVALVVLAFLIRKTREQLQLIAFSLIAGGAGGNLIDRVRYGEVVDFIQWYVKSYYWPSFNVADSSITIGVCLLAIDMMFQKKHDAGNGEPAGR